MFIEIPHKKMKHVGRIFPIGECECGYRHKFSHNDLDLDHKEVNAINFNSIYKCPKCGVTYNGLYSPVIKEQNNTISWLIKAAIVFVLLFGGMKVLSIIFKPEPVKTLNNSTNRELQEFLDWNQKQEKQKLDNEPAFDNKE